MVKLHDFILSLEYAVNNGMVLSETQIENEMKKAAIPVKRGGKVFFRFAGGEMITVKTCMNFARDLAA